MRVTLEVPITRPVSATGFFVGDTPHLAVGPSDSLTRFRSPASLSTPRWRPKLASLLEVVTLRQLSLSEVAGQHRVAVLIDAIGEVLARHADDATLPPLQVALVNKIPLLHNHRASSFVLVQAGGFVQLEVSGRIG